MAIQGVYIIENSSNGKVYVGSSIDVPVRLNRHRSRLRSGKHENDHLQKAWNKHGEGAFRFWVAEECAPEERVAREQWWLDMFEPFRERGYNICRNANGTTGFRHSDGTKAFISALNTGRKHTPEELEKISRSQRGRPKSQAWKDRMSALMRGRKISPETRAKISAARRRAKEAELA